METRWREAFVVSVLLLGCGCITKRACMEYSDSMATLGKVEGSREGTKAIIDNGMLKEDLKACQQQLKGEQEQVKFLVESCN